MYIFPQFRSMPNFLRGTVNSILSSVKQSLNKATTRGGSSTSSYGSSRGYSLPSSSYGYSGYQG